MRGYCGEIIEKYTHSKHNVDGIMRTKPKEALMNDEDVQAQWDAVEQLLEEGSTRTRAGSKHTSAA